MFSLRIYELILIIQGMQRHPQKAETSCNTTLGHRLVLVRIAQSNAQVHNLHVEQHKCEQRSILLVVMHNTHLMHNIIPL